MNDFEYFLATIHSKGLETYKRYYGEYPAIVEKFYPETDRLDIRVNGLTDGSSLLKNIKFCSNPYINIPLKQGDRVMVEFMWGNIDMGIARYSYHIQQNETSTKDPDIVSNEFFKIKTPNGLFFEEIKDGFNLKFKNMFIKMDSNVISIGNGETTLEISNDFTVTTSNGSVSLSSKGINKAIDVMKLMKILNQIILLYNNHPHVVTGQAALPTSNQITEVIGLNTLTLNDILLG